MVPQQKTIWVLGDQLNRSIGALQSAMPGEHRVLLVESTAKLAAKQWHRQRAHFVITSMRRFADDLRAEGFAVDLRRAPSLGQGLADHVHEFAPPEILATEPASWDGLAMLQRLGVTVIRSNQFLCHYEDFAEWASTRKHFKMEDFYRWQRRRLGYLMEGDQPAEGRWNFDSENREPPPKDARLWPTPLCTPLDPVDRFVLHSLPATCWGDEPDGTWATSRAEALRRLDYAISDVLPHFGPHEDAMLASNWHLAHTLLSPYLNIGLLLPGEVCDAVEAAYRAGAIPIASAEGFIRQVIGWREYVWGLYWLWMPEYRDENALAAHRPVPPVFTGGATEMRCVHITLQSISEHAYAHHIQRLMILSNLALLAGVDPWAFTEWMWASFIDGAEWVMLPNVIGMGVYADGGRMATKPYAAGGAYIDRMSDYCKGCRYDRKKRTGPDACPFTTLYWDFLDRHRVRFAKNPRIVQQVRAAERLSDIEAVRERASDVLSMLDAGTL